MAEINLSLEGINPIEFFGIDNATFNYIRNAFPKLKIVTRGTTIKAIGNENDIKLFSEKVEIVSNFLERYGSVTEKHIEELLAGLEPVDVPKGIDNIIMYGPYGNLIST